MPTANSQLPLVNGRLAHAEALTPAEARREKAKGEAQDFLEALYQAEFWLDQARKRFNRMYRTSFKEEAPDFEPEFRLTAPRGA